MSKYFNKVLSTLDKLSYFLPDIFLVLAVIEAVKGDYRDFVLFLIVYLAVCYGEYMYSKVRISREIMLQKVMPTIIKLDKEYSGKQYVTFDQLMMVREEFHENLDLVSDTVLKIGDAIIEVGREEQSKV